VASSWITRRATKDGTTRYRVEFRVGGRESRTRYGGSFKTKREADERKRWIMGELAAKRVPDPAFTSAVETVTLRTVAKRWQASRVDVSEGTLQTYRVALGRLLPRLGDTPIETIGPQTVADLVVELHAAKLKKQTIRKTVSVLAMVFDHAGIQPNPVRDRLTVKMPREEKRHVEPPTADHVEAVVRLLPARYRLPALVLDATGMRVGELEALTWGDLDEPRGRWRVAASASKTGRARWIEPPAVLYTAVQELVPRDDRHADRRVFDYMTSERLRTALTRACTAAGVPAFSPHDLRHRRVSLLHLAGMPWARIGEQVGHDDPRDDREDVYACRRGRARARLCGTAVVMSEDELRREVDDRAKRRTGGDDFQVEQKLIAALCRLPEDVREFALEKCFFVTIGRDDDGGFFVSPQFVSGRSLVVLNSAWKVDDFQSAVAHEIAHLWLGHPEFDMGPDVVRHEDEAAAKVREWGFGGIGSLRFGERP
jgi:integrase